MAAVNFHDAIIRSNPAYLPRLTRIKGIAVPLYYGDCLPWVPSDIITAGPSSAASNLDAIDAFYPNALAKFTASLNAQRIDLTDVSMIYFDVEEFFIPVGVGDIPSGWTLDQWADFCTNLWKKLFGYWSTFAPGKLLTAYADPIPPPKSFYGYDAYDYPVWLNRQPQIQQVQRAIGTTTAHVYFASSSYGASDYLRSVGAYGYQRGPLPWTFWVRLQYNDGSAAIPEADLRALVQAGIDAGATDIVFWDYVPDLTAASLITSNFKVAQSIILNYTTPAITTRSIVTREII